MSIKKPKSPSITYGWDSDVLIAWFMQEADKPLADMSLVIEEIERGKASLALSVLTLTEILETYSKEVYREFRQFCNRSNVAMVDVTPDIAELASKYRSHAVQLNKESHPQKPKIKTPDAIHLATASLMQVDVFHSFDLVVWNNNEIVDHLKISTPKLANDQLSLRGLDG